MGKSDRQSGKGGGRGEAAAALPYHRRMRVEETHLPVVFIDYIDHLARCQRCRIRALTFAMLLELIEEAYGPSSLPAFRSEAS
jgi:hypothetical protein